METMSLKLSDCVDFEQLGLLCVRNLDKRPSRKLKLSALARHITTMYIYVSKH